MNILLIGSGGREHALAWAIAASPLTDRLVIAPGSDAMAQIGTCVDIAVDDQAALLALADDEGPDLIVIGPEGPLVAGLVDRLEEAGHRAFGPRQAAAALEGSKAFAREAEQAQQKVGMTRIQHTEKRLARLRAKGVYNGGLCR